MKKFNLIVAACMISVLALTGCGNKNVADNGQATQVTETETQAQPAYESSVDVLTAMWDGYEGEKFFCYGGDFENPVEGAPGKISETNTDFLTYSLQIPEALQGDIKDVAVLIHGMNANTFTSAALKVETSDMAKYVEELKTSILTAQYMCGFPQQLVIVTTGDYVVYAYGSEAAVSEFEKSSSKNIEGAKVEVNQLFE